MKYGKQRWDIQQHRIPYTRIVRYKRGGVNLLATLKGMAPGQTFDVRTKDKWDKNRIRDASHRAGVKLKIIHYPLMNIISVAYVMPRTAAGKQLRDRRLQDQDLQRSLKVRRAPCFQGWRRIPTVTETGPGPVSKPSPDPANPTDCKPITPSIDIFS